MREIKFYLNQFGKSCGYVTCNRRGYFPLPTREGVKGLRVTLWVSCGRKHGAVA